MEESLDRLQGGGVKKGSVSDRPCVGLAARPLSFCQRKWRELQEPRE